MPHCIGVGLRSWSRGGMCLKFFGVGRNFVSPFIKYPKEPAE